MKPAQFTYEAPQTLEVALASLAQHGNDAKVIAGGQSLAPMMNMRLAQPAHLIDIGRIARLDFVREEAGRLVIGALVRHADVAHDPQVRALCPMLAHAAGTIGHYAIRQRGTIGGSLAHADPAAQFPLVAIALDAEIEVASEARRRTIPATEFFLSIFSTALKPEELVVAVSFPIPAEKCGWGFRHFARRAGDFAIASVAARIYRAPDGSVSKMDLAVGGVASTPQKLSPKILLTAGGSVDAGWVARIAAAASDAARYEDSEQFSVEYLRDLVAALAYDALQDALERTQ
jgi:Aerobic-type carbon monoxide dehydrogenase, middle subunit CoxM/CutM homologs